MQEDEKRFRVYANNVSSVVMAKHQAKQNGTPIQVRFSIRSTLASINLLSAAMLVLDHRFL